MLRDIVFRTHLHTFRRERFSCARGAHNGAASARSKGDAGEATCFPTSKGGLAARRHGQLGNSRTVFRNPQAIDGGVAMETLDGSNLYRMVTGYRAVDDTIGPAAMPMPNLEDKACLFAGATARCTLNMLHSYWQVLLGEHAQEIFTMVTPESCSRRVVFRLGC